jgi:MPBQ/MSBQ methyltransferase
MSGTTGTLRYPTPWAETAETSHLTSPEEMQDLLAEAGFTVDEVEDRSEAGIAFFRQRLAAAAEGPPPVGLHLLMGPTAREKFSNLLQSMEAGAVAPVVMIARRDQ